MSTNKYWVRLNANSTGLASSELNSIIQEIIQRKSQSVTKNPQLRQQIGQEYLVAVDPFIPKNSGRLRESGRATTDGRVYWSAVNPRNGYNYTQDAYTTEYANPTTPGTHPYWNEYVTEGTDAWDSFISAITPYIVEAYKNG